MAGEHILIVENESIVALDIQRRLESLGYLVDGIVATGAEAIERARARKPQLILMDIMLEGQLDGIQAAMIIRDQSQIPVLFLTAYADSATLERAKLAEPLGFIHKPLDPRELFSTIEVAIYKSSMDRRLRESERKYRAMVESVTDYIYSVKVENGRAVSTRHNPACLAVTGYSLEEYQADPDLWFKMVPEEDRPLVLEQAGRLLEGQPVQPLEHRVLHKSGGLIWVRNTPVPHRDDHGRLIGYDGLLSNITERKMAEEKLKEHARKLEIVNRVIATVNKAGNLSMLLAPVLDAALELIRFKCAGIYLAQDDAPVAELVCWRGTPAECPARLDKLPIRKDPYRNVLVKGETLVFNQETGELPEAQAQLNARSMINAPLISQDRIIGSLLMFNRDAHAFSAEEKSLVQSIGRQLGAAIAKLRSEAALRESEEKYRMLSEQSLAGIQIIKNGRLIFVNDGWCKIVGYTREEALAWKPDEFQKIVHPDDREFVMDQIRRKQAGNEEGVVPVYDYRYLCREGTTKWVLLHSKAIRFADGLAIVGVVVDITERKLAEQALAIANRQLKASEERLMTANQELSAANREKEVLLKEIHHRVKNNLQVISSLLNLQLGHVQDAPASAVIRECQNRIKSIAIVHEKLYQSRNLADIDLGEYIRSLVDHLFRTFLVAPDSIRAKLNIEHILLDIDEAIPCCLIINELVTNALKYAFPDEKGGEINISLRAAGSSRYVLTVSDNGIGFPAGVDFRNTSSLGLQLVMTFVEQLGGSIQMDSRQGTVYTIAFRACERGETLLSVADEK